MERTCKNCGGPDDCRWRYLRSCSSWRIASNVAPSFPTASAYLRDEYAARRAQDTKPSPVKCGLCGASAALCSFMNDGSHVAKCTSYVCGAEATIVRTITHGWAVQKSWQRPVCPPTIEQRVAVLEERARQPYRVVFSDGQSAIGMVRELTKRVDALEKNESQRSLDWFDLQQRMHGKKRAKR